MKPGSLEAQKAAYAAQVRAEEVYTADPSPANRRKWEAAKEVYFRATDALWESYLTARHARP